MNSKCLDSIFKAIGRQDQLEIERRGLSVAVSVGVIAQERVRGQRFGISRGDSRCE